MDCKICENSKTTKFEADNIYYQCNNCELIFIDPAAVVSSTEEKQRYEGHDNTHQNEGYVKMFEEFIEESIDPYLNLSEDYDVLDFGCGPGPVLADLLAAKGLEVDIYDPYFYPEKIFENKKYDLITSTEVFEHFSDPLKEMKLLSSHLKDGAYLAVMTSFHPGAADFKDWWYKWDPTHITFYNEKSFQKIASIFDLEIVYTDKEKYILFKS